jgi:geranylgeranyl transferase type-2 subunit alpha
VYTPETLDQTTKLLDFNPEFYTIWNYRRYILLKGLFPDSYVLDFHPLRFVSSGYTNIQGLPSLWSPYSRPSFGLRWLISKSIPKSTGFGITANGVSRTYLKDLTRLKNGDADSGRVNWPSSRHCSIPMLVTVHLPHFSDRARHRLTRTLVHAWDYRRYVLASLPMSFQPPRTLQQELGYTRKKIESNFSNFSAWHCRTKILGSLWESVAAEAVETEKDKGES